jgi:hypothetical protein
MAAVHQMCSEIIEKVNLSGLDFTINQTPYSIHFSIRKKFSKLSRTTTPISSQEPIFHDENLSDNLRRELLHTRNEYVKLYNFYNFEAEEKSKFEAELVKETELKNKVEKELAEVYKRLNAMELNEGQVKNLKSENMKLQDSFANKVIEFKHLKGELEEVKKDKNSLSVALKGSKQNVKEIEKAFAKERELFEKNTSELKEFKRKKLNEEREERLRKKKEMKKAKKKNHDVLTKDCEDDATQDTSEGRKEKARETLEVKNDARESQIDENENFDLDSFDAKSDIAANENVASEDDAKVAEKMMEEASEDVFIDENAQGFIGPKLPPRMTKEEIAAFYEEMMAKFKLDDLGIN